MTSDDGAFWVSGSVSASGRLGGLLLAALVGGAVAACGGDQPEGERSERVSISERNRARAKMSERSKPALDSGNAAFRRGDYERARQHYRRLVDQEPENAAAWVGVYMAERALGNEAAADSARERAAALSPEATRFHFGSDDSLAGPHDTVAGRLNMNRMGSGRTDGGG